MNKTRTQQDEKLEVKTCNTCGHETKRDNMPDFCLPCQLASDNTNIHWIPKKKDEFKYLLTTMRIADEGEE